MAYDKGTVKIDVKDMVRDIMSKLKATEGNLEVNVKPVIPKSAIKNLQNQLNAAGLKIKLNTKDIEAEFKQIKSLWDKYMSSGSTNFQKQFVEAKRNFVNSYGTDVFKELSSKSGITDKNFTTTIKRSVQDIVNARLQGNDKVVVSTKNTEKQVQDEIQKTVEKTKKAQKEIESATSGSGKTKTVSSRTYNDALEMAKEEFAIRKNIANLEQSQLSLQSGQQKKLQSIVIQQNKEVLASKQAQYDEAKKILDTENASYKVRRLLSNIKSISVAEPLNLQSAKQTDSYINKELKAMNTYETALQKIVGRLNEYRNTSKVVETRNQASNLQTLINKYKALAQQLRETDFGSAQFEDTKRQMEELRPVIDSYRIALEKSNQSLQAQGKFLLNFKDSLKQAFRSFTTYFSVTTLFFSMGQAIRQVITQVTNLDSAMVELRKVTDLTDTELESFKEQAYEIANNVGRTGSEVINAEAEFARAGFDESEIANLAEMAIVLTNVGDGIDDVRDASSSIISVLKAFNMEAEESTHIVDALNEVSNNFAIDANNLTDILERTSGTIGQTGTSFEELVGLGVGGYETLRNAEMVASGINMISQRMRGMTEDGEAVSGLIPKIEDALQTYTGGAVSMIDETTGGLRDTYSVLADLAKVYPDLNTQAKAYLNEVIAGNRQNKVLVAIMDNWENVADATETAKNSAGSAAKENATYLDSIEGKVAQLNNSLEKLGTDFLSSDTVKGVVDSLDGLVNLINNSGGLVNILTALASALGLLFTKEITKGITGLITKFSTFGTIITKFGTKLSEFRANVSAAGGGIKGFTTVLSNTAKTADITKISISTLVGGFSALLGVISIGVGIYSQWKAKQEAARKEALENAEAYDTQRESLDSYISQMESLDRQLQDGNLSDEESKTIKAQILDIEKNLLGTHKQYASQVEYTTSVIDTQNLSLQDKIEKMKEIKKLEDDEYASQNKKQWKKADDYLNKNRIESIGVNTEGNPEGFAGQSTLFSDLENFEWDEAVGWRITGTTDEIMNAIDEASARLNDLISGTTGNLKSNYENLLSQLDNIKEEYGDEYDSFKQLKEAEAVYLTDSDPEYSKMLESAKKVKDAYANALAGGDESEIEEAKRNYDAIVSVLEDISEKNNDIDDRYVADYILSLIGLGSVSQQTNNIIAEQADTLDDLRDATDACVSAIDTVASALEELSEDGSLSTSTVLDLIDQGYASALAFDTETGAITLNKDAVIALTNAKLEAQKADLSAQALVNARALGLEASAALTDASAQQLLAQAKDAVNNGTASDAQKNFVDLMAQVDTLSKIQNNIAKQGISGFTSSSKKKNSSSSSKEWWEKQLDSLKDQFNNSEITIEEYISSLQRLQGQLKVGSDAWKEVNNLLKENQVDKIKNDYEKGAIGLEEYIAQLKNLLSLYKQGTKAWDDLASEIKDAQEDLLDSYKSAFEDAQDAVSKLIDDELDKLQQSRDEQEEYYDKLIEEKENANEETEKELELEEARQELEKARNEKTKRVWHEDIGQWVWEADTDAIKEAEKNLADLENQAEIDALEKEKDEVLESYDEQIKALEDYRDSWDDVVDDYENQQARLHAAQILGADWEQQILGQRLDTLEQFRNRYNALLAEIGSYDNRSDANIASSTVPKFANGGKVDFTGMAMLHGSPNNPEWVLNNNQMENFIKLLNRPNTIKTKKDKQVSNVTTYNFDKLVLPNVQNPNEFINALNNLNKVTNNQ